MIRGTTPTFICKLCEEANIDFNQANHIYFTIAQAGKIITKTDDDLEVTDAHTLSVFLSQEESLQLRDNQMVEIQLNWTYVGPDGVSRRAATLVKEVKLEKQLLKQVIE
jgi:hypothetical protein